MKHEKTLVTLLCIIQLMAVFAAGHKLFSLKLENQNLKKEIGYLDKMIESDEAKLGVYKARYAWLSDPMIIAELSSSYLEEDANYKSSLKKTYSMEKFSALNNVRVYSRLEKF